MHSTWHADISEVKGRVAGNIMVQLAPGSLTAHTRTHNIRESWGNLYTDIWIGIER